MTVQSTTVYFAKCDAPGCKNKSSDYEHGNNTLYPNPKQLKRQFTETSYEDTLAESHSWLRVVEHDPNVAGGIEKHYCGEHTIWDDDTDTRVPHFPSSTANPEPAANPAEPTEPTKEITR